MKANPLTFAEMQKRTDIDIIGGIIDIVTVKGTFRGTIDDIDWWSQKYPRRIAWVDGALWKPQYNEWSLTKTEGYLNFLFNNGEFFSGPYATDRREIFFIFNSLIYFIIYPVGCEPPEKPFRAETCWREHCRIIGLPCYKNARVLF